MATVEHNTWKCPKRRQRLQAGASLARITRRGRDNWAAAADGEPAPAVLPRPKFRDRAGQHRRSLGGGRLAHPASPSHLTTWRSSAQHQLKEQRVRMRVVVIAPDLFESEGAVQLG